MTDLQEHRSGIADANEWATTAALVSNLDQRDPSLARSSSRWPLWIGAASIVGAAVVAGAVLSIAGNSRTTTTESTSVLAPPEFTQSEANGTTDAAAAEETTNGTADSTELSSSFVVTAPESGTFINYQVVRNLATDSFSTTAAQSSDGENWEPVELSGLPAGKLLAVDPNGSVLRAFIWDLSDDPNGPGSPIAISTDGLHWVPITELAPTTYEHWSAEVLAHDAAPLADGRILVVGSQSSVPDFAALGLDADDICSHDTSVNAAQETILEVWHCDDNSTETLPMPGPFVEPLQAMLWTVEADGTNPVAVAMPQDGMVAALSPLIGTTDSVSAAFSSEENRDAITFFGVTTDAATWNLQAVSMSIYPDAETMTTFEDTTFRATNRQDEGPQRVQRSTDGGRTWADTAPFGEALVIGDIAAGPAGVAVFASSDPAAGAAPSSSSNFDYVAPDGTHLVGGSPPGRTTWVLTTPSGDTYEYELDESLLGGTDSGQSDPNVVVEFSDQGIPTFTVLSPVDGTTLLTVDAATLWTAKTTDAPVLDDSASCGLGCIYFSADAGTTWLNLGPVAAKWAAVTVGDDEVLYSVDQAPVRVPVPSR